jgi:CheY-like chemotaxis protein/predicted regulator of Ras-like GTPase activity (Roadblock/LC7/MglB family)
MPKVLVIDDSISVRKVVERALAGKQVDVVCAASGIEALECMERDAPDVIVCDVVMPDRDGYEICEFVKKHPRLGDIPVLLMSGIVNDEVRQRAARARSEGVLAKPFAAEDLLKRLDNLLGPLPPRVADAPAAKSATPAQRLDGTPTLMPVSSLTLPPVDVPKPRPAVAAPPAAATVFAPPAAPAPVVPPPPPPPPVVPPPPSVEPTLLNPTVAVVTPPERAPRTAEPIAGSPAPPRIPLSAPTDAAAGILAQFTAMDGVQWAVLSDREGFVVEATTNAGIDADVAAALSACLAESSDGLGKELGRGALQSNILEYEKGMVVVYGVGASGLLAVGLNEPAVLGKVRYFAKKALPELTRSL